MRSLKILLAIIYPILIILLLLTNCKGCRHGDDTLAQGGRDTTVIHHRVDTLWVETPGRRDTLTADTTSEVSPEDSAAIDQAQHVGQQGNLKITLLWDFPADIDLHVTQPNGRRLYYANKSDSSTGGFLDVDNRAGGRRSAENMYWRRPPKGKYLVQLHYYQASEVSGVAGRGTCTVVVFQEGKSPQTYKVNMNRINDKKNVVTVNVD